MPGFKEKYKNIIKIISFFLILVSIVFFLSVKAEKAFLENDSLVPVRNKCIYSIQREPENSIDVLIIGDSLSYSTFSPVQLWRDYGIVSFVCAQPSQKIWETEELLKTALKTQKPKLIILEPDCMFRESVKLKNINDYIDTSLEYCIPLFRGHDIWKSVIIKKEYLKDSFKGFILRSGVKSYNKGDYMKKTDVREKISDLTFSHLKNIADLCKEAGADFLIVSAPSPINYNYPRHILIRECAENLSVNYLDLNYRLDQIGIDWKTDTLDRGDHLNLSGAEKATAYFGKYLAANYVLPDHRGDEKYAAWNEEISIYEEIVNKNLAQIRGEK